MQSLNEEFPMNFTDVGMSICANEEQSSNACALMNSTEEGIFISVIDLHFKNDE